MKKALPDEKILESNLKYFEIHAAQRLTVFNFYVAISGTSLAGIAAISQASSRFSLAGAILGLLLAVVSFVFYKLDVRTSFLVKHAEQVIRKIESEYLPSELSVFAREDSRTSEEREGKHFPSRMYTYGELFRAIFWIFGAIGAAGFLVMSLRAGGVVDWASASEKSSEVTVVVRPITPSPREPSPPQNSVGADARGPASPPNNVGEVAREANAFGENEAGTNR